MVGCGQDSISFHIYVTVFLPKIQKSVQCSFAHPTMINPPNPCIG